ncbi:MAG TPA: iron ABC transporter substrate-binding protein [Acidimicrobiales bacterium]|jgi:iron(III) transport system substrate-binding protein
MAKRWFLVASLVTMLATLTVACSSGRSTGLTVYSGQHEQTMTALVTAFEKATGVHVKVRSDDEATLANQILQEGSHSPADVFVAENPPALTLLEEHQLLAPVDAATLAAVPKEDSSSAGDFVGVSARTAALAYNTDKLTADQLPNSVLDFANPSWKGRVGFAPTETDFQPIITTIAKLHGEDAAQHWLTGLKANGKVYSDNETLIAAVNKGEVASGLVDHYYWYRLRDEVGANNVHSALHFYAPGDPGNLVDISGAGILKSSKHQADAQRFLAYLTSQPAQTIIATSESWEYPIVPGVTDTRLEVPFDQLHPPPMTISDLGDGTASLKALQQVGLL